MPTIIALSSGDQYQGADGGARFEPRRGLLWIADALIDAALLQADAEPARRTARGKGG